MCVPKSRCPPGGALGTIRLASIRIRDRLEAGVAADLWAECLAEKQEVGEGERPPDLTRDLSQWHFR